MNTTRGCLDERQPPGVSRLAPRMSGDWGQGPVTAKTDEAFWLGTICALLRLSLSRGFRLLLALYTRLYVMFALADLRENTRLRALPLETAERAVKGFVLLDSYFRHIYPSPL